MNRIAVLIFSLPLVLVFGIPIILSTMEPKENLIFSTPLSRVDLGEAQLTVAIADTAYRREQGLSNIASLPEDHGLLFAFSKSDRYGIWMKNMQFSIDIVWFDDNFRVIAIEEDVTPESYPDVYRPEDPARYILEASAGVAEKYEIEIGQKAKIDPDGVQ